IGDQIVTEAMKHLGKPYVHATQGPDTFDCSGFTYYVYKKIDPTVVIYPGSSSQLYFGTYVSYENLRPGDIVCFDISETGTGECGHTGIYIGNNQHINALNEGAGVTINAVRDGYYWDGPVMTPVGLARFLGGRRYFPYSDNPNPGTDPNPPTPNRGNTYATQPGTVIAAQTRNSTDVVDLGAAKDIKAITWTMTMADPDTLFELETSLDGVTWSLVGTFTKPTSGTERRGVTVEARVRYLRTKVSHASGAASAGHVVNLTAIAADTTTPPPTTTWTHRVTEAVNFRTGAGTSNAIIRTLQPGTRLRLISTTPTSANGYQWYNVEAEGFGTGWLINAFEPITNDPTPPPTTTWTHVVTNGPLNLRSGAGTSYGIIGSLANGVKLKVLEGPTSSGGYTWYKVATDTSLTGWCVNGFSPL
ncbi:MAG: SH3 domain-containing protein, partial [Thermomicrobiales bacterium]